MGMNEESLNYYAQSSTHFKSWDERFHIRFVYSRALGLFSPAFRDYYNREGMQYQ